MDLSIQEIDRLASIKTIDITTFGRRSGLPRRIEIWWFRVDGKFIITGTPGKRDWIANVMHDPRIVVHANGHDIETTVTPVLDLEFRRHFFTRPESSWYATQEELDRLVRTAPMIEVHLPPEP